MKALFCSDLHLKGEKPVARLDTDWLGTQRAMLQEIVDLANYHILPLVLVGDIFDHPRVSTEVLNMAIQELNSVKFGVKILAGNHDLPTHSFALVDQSSIGVLLKIFTDIEFENSQWLSAYHFGRDEKSTAKVMLTHQLIFPDQASKPPTDKGKTADELLNEFDAADWIICGDGHFGFHHIRKSQGGDRHVINLGCTIRHKASEINYQPSVWAIDTDAGTVDRINLHDDPERISRAHLDIAEEKETRVGIFLSIVKGSGTISLSFMDNLESKMTTLHGQDLEAVNAIIERVKDCK